MARKPKQFIGVKIMDIFTHYPDEVITSERIAQQLGVTTTQVSASIWNIQKKEPWKDQLKTVTRGKAWKYSPQSREEIQDKVLFEQMYKVDSDTVLLRNEDGIIFEAKLRRIGK